MISITKIKICGLSRLEDIAYVNEALPDYIGFVFAKSRRQINDKLAQELKSELNPLIKTAGVFVNEDLERIIQLCRQNIIDIIQLHGEEGEDYIRKLKEKVANPIMKAVRVRNITDIEETKKFSCDYLLFDTYREGQYGGSGDTFDWSLITKVNKPYFLAGGINSDNVTRAITGWKPFAVDVSSGVETEGVKDRNKIIDIIKKVRSVG